MTTTLRPEGTAQPEGAATELRNAISGDVFAPGDPEFEELRVPWNRAFEHHPALIVAPRSNADVSAAVRHAELHRLPIVIQATGHGVARTADDAMLLLTHHMREVTVEPRTRTATVQAGAKWEHVLGPATDVGLAPLLGSTPDVGVVGYTLGGGMGWIARKYGLAADRVRAIEIVTADAQLHVTTPFSEPDLFWALRGGGAGSLGVVTSMQIELVPLETLYAGNLFYPAAAVHDVAARYRDWIAHVPDELTSALTMMNFPADDDVPEPLRGSSFTIVRGAYVGSDDDGEALLSHWRDWRSPEIDMWGRIPFSEIAGVSNDPVDPLAGLGTTEWFDTISDDVTDVLASAVFDGDVPYPLLMAELRHAGGAMEHPPEHAGAYGNRRRQHVLELVGVASHGDDVELVEAALTTVRQRLEPHAVGGAYLNFLDGAEKAERSAEGFEPEAWQRLQAVKATYDPHNLFSHGVAIS